jgi:hypothetical protein
MPTAIEGFLRYESPIQRAWRRVKEDIEMEGHTIRAGELVFLMPGSANHDSSQFAAPDVLDLRRKLNTHVAFGYGTHFCLGAPLARLELRLPSARCCPGCATFACERRWNGSAASVSAACNLCDSISKHKPDMWYQQPERGCQVRPICSRVRFLVSGTDR